jgi:hypothetical protein
MEVQALRKREHDEYADLRALQLQEALQRPRLRGAHGGRERGRDARTLGVAVGGLEIFVMEFLDFSFLFGGFFFRSPLLNRDFTCWLCALTLVLAFHLI